MQELTNIIEQINFQVGFFLYKNLPMINFCISIMFKTLTIHSIYEIILSKYYQFIDINESEAIK